MIMFEFFYNAEDSKPAYYLQTNPQNRDVEFDDYWIIDIAKKLNCKRIAKITTTADNLRWWVAD